jgi:hypothetical protein
MTPPTGSGCERSADGGAGRPVGFRVSRARFAGRLVAGRAFGGGADAAFVRFSLRLPGRERGRFSSTPPSSVIAGSLG